MRYVIIGNGAAGYAAAGSIADKDPSGELYILSDDPHPAYYRPLIPSLIVNGTGKSSLFRDEKISSAANVVHINGRAVTISPSEKIIKLENNEILPYDRLLISTGSSAVRPAIPGSDLPGVYTLRTIDDAEAIKKATQGMDRALVIGGGRVGMKAAFALLQRGLEVTVVEKLSRVVPLQFDDTAGEIVSRAVESQGIRLILGHTAREIVQSNGHVKGIVLDDGSFLEAGLVVVAVGVRPKVGLAQESGVKINRGVLVNDQLETSVSNIFAAGDVVETSDLVTGEDIVSGIWTNAVEMGRIAGENMAGGKARYPGAFSILNSLELAGIPTVAVGLINPPSGSGHQVYSSQSGDIYRKLVIRENRLVGTIMVGDIGGAGVLTGLIRRKADVGPYIDALTNRRPSYAPWLNREMKSS